MERPLSSALITDAYGAFVLTLLGPTTITVVTNYKNVFGSKGLGRGFIGLAEGVAILIGVARVAQLSGASLDPARSFGPAVVSLVFSTTPIYWFPLYVIGPILGALVAAALYRAMFKGDN